MKTIKEFTSSDLQSILEKYLDINIYKIRFFYPEPTNNSSSPYPETALTEVSPLNIIVQAVLEE